MMQGGELRTCVLCGEVLEERERNNAAPVDVGECCDACNVMVVIPHRIAQAREEAVGRGQND